ncbi:MAG TPA: hypothetical protein VL968_01210, partial [Rhodocyclaceae bacterium]|nr:hypothetical protein [Rhodocyclaceae bacterium]
LEEKIAIIPITPNALETTGFDELPENNIDKSDRKFLAVALCGNGTLINALDSDWHEQAKFISDIGVEVKQLCPDHSCFPQG